MLACLLGHDLINCLLERIAGGRELIRSRTAEPTRSGLSMAIRACHFHSIKFGKQGDVLLHGCKRLQAWRQGEVFSLVHRMPGPLHDSVGDVEETSSDWRPRRRGSFCHTAGFHDLQQGQCQCGPGATENGPAREGWAL